MGVYSRIYEDDEPRSRAKKDNDAALKKVQAKIDALKAKIAKAEQPKTNAKNLTDKLSKAQAKKQHISQEYAKKMDAIKAKYAKKRAASKEKFAKKMAEL